MIHDDKLPFMSHLEELRKRLIASLIAVAIGFGLAYYFSQELFDILSAPLRAALPPDGKLVYTHLIEPFIVYIKIGLIGGIVLSSPFLFYQIWMFITPGLYQNEKKLVIPFILSATFLFLVGALFGFKVVFPVAFKFLAGFSNENLQLLPKMSEYFSLSLNLLLAFGISFELPVVLYFLARIGMVNAGFLKKKRKFFIVIAFVVAAIITPTTDPFTQALMAVPLIFLYEIGILLAMWAGRQRARKKEDPIEEK